MKYRIIILLIFTIFLSGCLENQADKKELTISSAISLKDVMNELGNEFQSKHSDTKLYFNFGASGTLEKQIEQGAPVDIYASASQRYMDLLEKKGLILNKTNFTQNKLVIISHKKISLKDLNKTKKIAIGNPEIVPAGKYAVIFLKNSGLYKPLKPKLIYGENVRQVLDYVLLREVDAGFVYFSDTLNTNLSVLMINETMYPKIVYPIAVLKDSKNKELSQEFIKYIKSEKGQNILKKYGFR